MLSLKHGILSGLNMLSGISIGLIAGIAIALMALGIMPVPSGLLPNPAIGGAVDRDLPDSPYRDEIKSAAFVAGIDPNVLHAIVEIESGGDPNAISYDENGEPIAYGLAQLIPSMQKSFGVTDPFDPTQNLAGSAAFLSILLNKYDRIDLAIAAYHAGEPMVDACNCVPRDVDADYVNRFMKAFDPIILPYRIKSAHVQAMHGEGLPGRDYAVDCDVPIYAPITGEVAAVGHDGYVGPHGSDNSFMKINGAGIHAGIEIVLLHGEYEVAIGDNLIQGVSKIGYEASIGNSTGCHTHFTMKHQGVFVDPAEYIR